MGSELSVSPQPRALPAGLFAQGDGLLADIRGFVRAHLHPRPFAGSFHRLNQDISVRSGRQARTRRAAVPPLVT